MVQPEPEKVPGRAAFSAARAPAWIPRPPASSVPSCGRRLPCLSNGPTRTRYTVRPDCSRSVTLASQPIRPAWRAGPRRLRACGTRRPAQIGERVGRGAGLGLGQIAQRVCPCCGLGRFRLCCGLAAAGGLSAGRATLAARGRRPPQRAPQPARRRLPSARAAPGSCHTGARSGPSSCSSAPRPRPARPCAAGPCSGRARAPWSRRRPRPGAPRPTITTPMMKPRMVPPVCFFFMVVTASHLAGADTPSTARPLCNTCAVARPAPGGPF
jgi:hypothetical protein